MNVHTFAQRKQQHQKISMVTCYDHWSAQILNTTEIDCLLVGDSLAVVMYGYESTVHATVDMMTLHVGAVARGAPDKFIVADMPFLTCSKGLGVAMDTVERLMQAGAHAVKIEGDSHQLEIIRHIVEAGVPVMGHLGLTPQSIHHLGGHLVQGKDEVNAAKIVESARRLEAAGCFSLVLECVPTALGGCVSQALKIPTIGIGAGPQTDGQVLVLQDLLGVNPKFKPKFLRQYASGHSVVSDAVNQFHGDVVAGEFPALAESYR